jgi:hypothetical protein
MHRWFLLVMVVGTIGTAGTGCWSDRPSQDTTPRPSLATVESPPEPWQAREHRTYARPVQDRCTHAMGHVFDLARKDPSSTAAFTAAMLDELEHTSIDGCHETEWSEETLACSEEATSISGVGECFRMMTSEQREDFDRRITDVRLKHRNSPPTPSPPPPPPSP